MIKKSISKTKEQLIIENEELRSRLAETEETLYSIRNGEVDAIVIPGTDGEQIFSISSAETPYRTFIEKMNEGALTLTKEGMILYCNIRFAELVHQPIKQIIGSFFKKFIAPDDISKFECFLAQTPDNKNNVFIISLSNSLYLKLSISLLPEYLHGDNYILIATDISEMKKYENELLEIKGILEDHIEELRVLHIDNVNVSFEVECKRILLENANNKLFKEITGLNRVIGKLKQQLDRKKDLKLKHPGITKKKVPDIS